SRLRTCAGNWLGLPGKAYSRRKTKAGGFVSTHSSVLRRASPIASAAFKSPPRQRVDFGDDYGLIPGQDVLACIDVDLKGGRGGWLLIVLGQALGDQLHQLACG